MAASAQSTRYSARVGRQKEGAALRECASHRRPSSAPRATSRLRATRMRQGERRLRTVMEEIPCGQACVARGGGGRPLYQRSPLGSRCRASFEPTVARVEARPTSLWRRLRARVTRPRSAPRAAIGRRPSTGRTAANSSAVPTLVARPRSRRRRQADASDLGPTWSCASRAGDNDY